MAFGSMRRHSAQKRSRADSHNLPRLAAGDASSYSQRLCVQTFLIFLEERRVLYAPGTRLKETDTLVSVKKIADECEWCLAQLEDDSQAAMLIGNTANVCCSFASQSTFPSRAEFYMTLGALRLFFADMIARLSLAYDVKGTLPAISIMPARNQDRVAAKLAGPEAFPATDPLMVGSY
jgi:hypothetical protein